MTAQVDPAATALLTTRVVNPGAESDFQTWVGQMGGAASLFPGHLGDSVFRPTAHGDPWVLIQRFRDQASARAWQTSPERSALFDELQPGDRHDEVHREVLGMETWCAAPSDTTTIAPPRWKMALTAFAAVLPISLLGNVLLAPLINPLPLPARVLILALLFSTLMTYLMMPTVTTVLRRWLYPAR